VNGCETGGTKHFYSGGGYVFAGGQPGHENSTTYKQKRMGWGGGGGEEEVTYLTTSLKVGGRFPPVNARTKVVSLPGLRNSA